MVTVSGSTYQDRYGATHYRFQSSAIGSSYASGSFEIVGSKGQVYYTLEQARKKAEEATARYFGIPSIHEDEVRIQAEIQEQAQIEQLHKRREEARQGFGGRFSDAAMRDVVKDPGAYLPSYIQKLPQNKAEELIKQGKIGGWQVGDRYFRTKQEADIFINRGTTIPSAASTAQGKPWMPEAYGQLQVTKDLEKKFESTYEPYVTIEGTTTYRPRSQPTSVTVPRFGKMIPAKEDPAMKFISENFEKGERFVSDRLMLHEILNPAIKTIEERKRPLTLIEKRSGKTYDTSAKLASSEFIIGGLTGIRDKPLTAAGNMALALLVTKGIGALPKVAGVTAGIGKGAVASKVSAVNILGAGLAGMYGYDVSRRITTSSTPSRTAGGIVATELLPFGVGGYLGAKPLPKIPYTLSKPTGVLIERKGVYTVSEPSITPPSQSLTIINKFPKKEGWATFTSKTKDGLTDIYIRPPNSEIPNVLKMVRGKGEYVKTKYGSYFKITPEGKITESTLLKLEGKNTRSTLRTIIDKIPYKLSRRLEIDPSILKFTEEVLRPGLPKYTWDMDIAANILRPGKGTMRSESFGGTIKGAPTRKSFIIPEQRVQLTTASQKPMVRLGIDTKPLSMNDFKTVIDERPIALAEFTRNVLGAKTITQIRPKTITIEAEPKPQYKYRAATKVSTEPMLQPETASAKKFQLQVMDRSNIQNIELEKIFEIPTEKIKIARKAESRIIESSSKIIPILARFPQFKPNISTASKIHTRNVTRAIELISPTSKIQPTPQFKIVPTPASRQRTKPLFKTQQESKPKPKAKYQPQTKTITPKVRPPETPTTFKIPKFTAAIDNLAEKRKKRSKYIWDVDNPVPTLEQVLG